MLFLMFKTLYFFGITLSLLGSCSLYGVLNLTALEIPKNVKAYEQGCHIGLFLKMFDFQIERWAFCMNKKFILVN